MDSKALGTTIIAVGIAVLLVGISVRFGLFSWFGRLPGDLRFEGENTRVYIPLTSMLLVSVVLSLIAWLGRRAS